MLTNDLSSCQSSRCNVSRPSLDIQHKPYENICWASLQRHSNHINRDKYLWTFPCLDSMTRYATGSRAIVSKWWKYKNTSFLKNRFVKSTEVVLTMGCVRQGTSFWELTGSWGILIRRPPSVGDRELLLRHTGSAMSLVVTTLLLILRIYSSAGEGLAVRDVAALVAFTVSSVSRMVVAR